MEKVAGRKLCDGGGTGNDESVGDKEPSSLDSSGASFWTSLEPEYFSG